MARPREGVGPFGGEGLLPLVQPVLGHPEPAGDLGDGELLIGDHLHRRELELRRIDLARSSHGASLVIRVYTAFDPSTIRGELHYGYGGYGYGWGGYYGGYGWGGYYGGYGWGWGSYYGYGYGAYYGGYGYGWGGYYGWAGSAISAGGPDLPIRGEFHPTVLDAMTAQAKLLVTSTDKYAPKALKPVDEYLATFGPFEVQLDDAGSAASSALVANLRSMVVARLEAVTLGGSASSPDGGGDSDSPSSGGTGLLGSALRGLFAELAAVGALQTAIMLQPPQGGGPQFTAGAKDRFTLDQLVDELNKMGREDVALWLYFREGGVSIETFGTWRIDMLSDYVTASKQGDRIKLSMYNKMTPEEAAKHLVKLVNWFSGVASDDFIHFSNVQDRNSETTDEFLARKTAPGASPLEPANKKFTQQALQAAPGIMAGAALRILMDLAPGVPGGRLLGAAVARGWRVTKAAGGRLLFTKVGKAIPESEFAALASEVTGRQIPLQTVRNALRKACFAAGTPLRTPCGSRAIESLRPGDLVLSRYEHDSAGAVEAKIVEEVFRRYACIWELRLGGQVVRTTADHPFYRDGEGWVEAGGLRVGDRLVCEDGTHVSVEGVRDTGTWQAVYNLRVADWHTYFVGCDEWGFSVWAHNSNECAALTARIDKIVTLFGKHIRGFANAGEVFERANNLRNRLRALGYTDVQVGI